MKSVIVHIQYSVEVEPIEIEDYGRIYIDFESRHRNVLFSSCSVFRNQAQECLVSCCSVFVKLAKIYPGRITLLR
jgi:hypothetical protein